MNQWLQRNASAETPLCSLEFKARSVHTEQEIAYMHTEPFCMLQMFSEVMKVLAGDTPLPSSPYSPWRFGNPLQLLQDLRDAGFSGVECTTYPHAMTFTVPDLVEFQLGPHGQSRPTLELLKASGRDNIDEEGKQVSSLFSEPA